MLYYKRLEWFITCQWQKLTYNLNIFLANWELIKHLTNMILFTMQTYAGHTFSKMEKTRAKILHMILFQVL